MNTTAATANLPIHHTLQEAQHRADTLTAVTATFLAIAWFTVSLRLWVRGLLIRSIGWDDWAMVATNVCLTVLLYGDRPLILSLGHLFRLLRHRFHFERLQSRAHARFDPD